MIVPQTCTYMFRFEFARSERSPSIDLYGKYGLIIISYVLKRLVVGQEKNADSRGRKSHIIAECYV